MKKKVILVLARLILIFFQKTLMTTTITVIIKEILLVLVQLLIEILLRKSIEGVFSLFVQTIKKLIFSKINVNVFLVKIIIMKIKQEQF